MTKEIPVPKEALIDLYWNKNTKPREIAMLFGIKNERTVRKKMEKYGIRRKSLSEANTINKKFSFSENHLEKAYLLGLRAGDFHAKWMRHTIRVQTSTTHPALFDVLCNSFENYGKPSRYLYNGPHGLEWFIYADLNSSFEFLINKPNEIPDWIIADNQLFFAFLAAYSDCEGNWHLTKSHEIHTRFTFRLRTSDKKILENIKSKLESLGYSPNLNIERAKGTISGYGVYSNDFYSLIIGKKEEVIRLIQNLLPHSKHNERITKMNYILTNKYKNFANFIIGWDNLVSELKKEKITYKNNGTNTNVIVDNNLIST